MFRNTTTFCFWVLGFFCLAPSLLSQEKEKPEAAQSYDATDRLFKRIVSNLRANADLQTIVDIDHSRLAAKAGSKMPPAHVVIWSDAKLEAQIIKLKQLAAIDLPLRTLAYTDSNTKDAKVIFNSYDYLANRHRIPRNDKLKRAYEEATAQSLKGIDKNLIAKFPTDQMKNSGLITLESPFDFAETEKRVVAAIKAQSDAVIFGKVDFASRSKKQGVQLRPTTLHLFGGPGPGGKAMANAPTLGLDAFCQKLLVWEDSAGKTHVTFNNLLALAKRQGVKVNLPLRIINQRLSVTFKKALER